MTDQPAPTWHLYTGRDEPHDGIDRLPPPPNWRSFDGSPVVPPPANEEPEHRRRLGDIIVPPDPDDRTVPLINAALYLRRPLLVSGRPGTGKSSLAYAVAKELRLGPVLRWPITSRSTLAEGLYRYDPIARLGDEQLRQTQAKLAGTEPPPHADIGRYLTLGPLGTALLPYERPRVLLIDEIDKSDIDLPNDLLNVFEEGEYEIDELTRLPVEHPVTVRTADPGGSVQIERGRVRCRAFPFIVLTSNGEREFPPAFLRRCLRLDLKDPSDERIAAIVAAHLGPDAATQAAEIVSRFLERRHSGRVATDQLLNAVYLSLSGGRPSDETFQDVVDALMRSLEAVGAE